MTAADQIAEINAQYAERVKLLERERDAKIAMVRGRCDHDFEEVDDSFSHEFGTHVDIYNRCLICGETSEYVYSPLDDDVI